MSGSGPVGIETLLAQRTWVRALARRLVLDDAAADDLEQQAWVDALRAPPRREEGIRGWFATVLRRRARDAWRERERRGRRESAAARPEAARSTAEVVADAEAHRRVVEAVLALEEPYREVVLLRFFEDLPPREVAARIGVPAETVRTRTRRALGRLREALDRGSGGDRAAWIAALVPLAGLRPETGAAASTAAGLAGGAVMGTKAAVAAGVAGAVAGALLGGAAAVRLVEVPPPAGTEEARADVRELRARLEALESAHGGGAGGGAAGAAAEERIAALEAALAEVRSRPAASAPAAPVPAPSEEEARRREEAAARGVAAMEKAKAVMGELKKRDAETLAELRRKVLDRSLGESERAAALMRLRGWPGGIDREVVVAVLDLFRVAHPFIREGLLRDLHGTKDPDVKQAMLDALRSDPDEKVRERAAKDIDDYLDDPEVVRALEAARDGDASTIVRLRAAATLERKGGKD